MPKCFALKTYTYPAPSLKPEKSPLDLPSMFLIDRYIQDALVKLEFKNSFNNCSQLALAHHLPPV